jgi:hypothetical protein
MTQLEQLTYRLTGFAPRDQFAQSVQEIVEAVQKYEREKCMEAARAWVGDTNAAVNVDTFIKQRRSRPDADV